MLNVYTNYLYFWILPLTSGNSIEKIHNYKDICLETRKNTITLYMFSKPAKYIRFTF